MSWSPGYSPVARCALAAVIGFVLQWPAAVGSDEPDAPLPGPPAPIPAIYAIRAPALFLHDAGTFHVMVTNVGVIGNPDSGVDLYGGRWRGSEYLHSLELWVGAVAEDGLEYVSNAFELRPGLDPLETIYPSYEGAPGGRREGLTLLGGDDDEDGVADEEFLNGKDDDGDGEIDEDFAAISQQMFCCEYTDDTREALDEIAEHRPLHLSVRQSTYAWAMEEQNEFIGVRYEIRNAGTAELRDVYVGTVLDGDVGRKSAAGYWQDDRVWILAQDTTLVDETADYWCREVDQSMRNCRYHDVHLDLACMGDVSREEGGSGGDDLSEEARGEIGLLLLSHTTDPQGLRAPSSVGPHALTFFQKRATVDLEDFTRYRYLARGVHGPDSSVTPADYACVLSVGPFPRLLPGEAVELEVALVVGAGRRGLMRNAVRAEQIHEGRWCDLDGNAETGCGGAERCLFVPPGSLPFDWANPCIWPSRTMTIKNTACDDPVDWVDDDCNCCTPLQEGTDDCAGRESLVRWVGRIAPPPPTLSTELPGTRVRVEQDRRIFLEWDNASELVVDPVSQEIRFCGYRVWRVEGWERPLGSLGPAPEDWQLVAELAPDPVGSQLDLQAHTNPAAAVVEQVPSPVAHGEWLDRYAVGRYFYVDSLGLKNGVLYFYDVTSFSCWREGGKRYENSRPPGALEADGVRPRWDAVASNLWKSKIAVVPNPYHGSAGWDLIPSRADPLGTHVEFIGLPERECDIRIYTLAGDLVQTLHHDGGDGTGSISWNLLSRNNQDVTSGVYLFAVTCAGETVVDRVTIIR